MPLKNKGYTPLQAKGLDSGDEEQDILTLPKRLWPNPLYHINLILFIALFLSVSTNFVLGLLKWPVEQVDTQHRHASTYAGMTKTKAVPYTLGGPYSLVGDRDKADEHWADIDVDAGVIALSDSYVSEQGLPEAMRFPWDDTKGIYFVNAYHDLHCLKKIYRALNEYDRGLPQSGSFPHVIHCLDALRQDVICNADDTPRYAVMKKETPTGGGQYRQCRDWQELEQWAEENTACWRYVNSTDPDMDQLERFKYCPEGSPYLEKARERYADAGPLM